MKIKGGDDYNSSRSVAWPARGKDPVVMYAAHGSVVIRANPLVKRQMRHRKHVLLVTNPQGVSNARRVLPATRSLLTPLRDGRLSSPKSAAEGVAEAPHGVSRFTKRFPFPVCVSGVFSQASGLGSIRIPAGGKKRSSENGRDSKSMPTAESRLSAAKPARALPERSLVDRMSKRAFRQTVSPKLPRGMSYSRVRSEADEGEAGGGAGIFGGVSGGQRQGRAALLGPGKVC